MKRIINLLRYLRWKRRFKWFARSASLGKPDLLLNPEGISLDWGVTIRPRARLECHNVDGKLGEIQISEGANIHFYFHCAAAKLVKIGTGVLIAGRVYITDHDHSVPWQSGKLVVAPVVIEHDCWLGEGCAILKGVTLGHHCVVGANAVVTRSFPPGSVIGGVPARLIKQIEIPVQSPQPLHSTVSTNPP